MCSLNEYVHNAAILVKTIVSNPSFKLVLILGSNNPSNCLYPSGNFHRTKSQNSEHSCNWPHIKKIKTDVYKHDFGVLKFSENSFMGT